ncbi:glycosyltransferase [Flavicella marina]|uniref:glycosyltransferase n=1 Tax=Flavicella marina TaxID=1475951 RepID=UPI001264B4CE|nr:glycosyltransferase [Flavicella marina]
MLFYLFVVFYVIVAIQCLYYLLFLTPLHKKKQSILTNSEPISVIICAKNEANNLKRFLPSLLNQNYSGEFEIVLINDRSTDDTALIIDLFASSNENIKVVTIEECENFWGSKKYALTLGIKAASHEHLLLTDADCKPLSNQWIQSMANNFTQNKHIVLGYGAYKKNKSFINKLIRYETLLTAIQYFSYSKIGLTYMGVGRNLAYTKSDFFKVNGFIKHIKIKSGDDDLFINEIATKNNTSFTLDTNSFTESLPKQNFKDWILQKRRHISTAHLYKLKHKLPLGIFYISQLLFYALAGILVIINPKSHTILALIAIRYILVYASIGFFSKKIKEVDLIILTPILEIALILTQLYIYLKNKLVNPNHW